MANVPENGFPQIIKTLTMWVSFLNIYCVIRPDMTGHYCICT